MKERRFRIQPGDLKGHVASLRGETARYVRSVLRLRPEQAVTLFDGEGHEWHGRIDSVGKREIRVTVESGGLRTEEVEGPRVVLLFSLARGAHTDLAIQKATELGVSAVHLFTSERTVAIPRPGGDPVRIDRLNRIAVDASRQSGRASVPEVHEPVPLEEALEAAAEGDRRRILLTPAARDLGLVAALADWRVAREELVLVVGPEGGFEDEEVERAIAIGYRAAHMGPFVLRTETAAIAAVATARLWACAGPGGDAREPALAEP